MNYSLIFILLFIPLNSFSNDFFLPKEWRFPDDGELNDFWRAGDLLKYSKGVSDFNNDGVDDFVVLAISVDEMHEGLLVYLKGDDKWIILDKIKFIKKHGVTMGLSVYPIGRYNIWLLTDS